MKIIMTGKKAKAGVVVGDYERTEPVVKISEEDLRDRLDKHEKWLQGDMNIDERIDFSNLDLSKVDLSDVNLAHAYLRGSILRDAKLLNTNLKKADIANVDLSGAFLAGADLSEAFGTNANMNKVNFARYTGENSKGEKSTYIAHAKITNARMSGAILSNTNLFRVNLSRSELERADFTNAQLVSADLSEAIVQNSNLKDANLLLANLTKTDFRNSSLDNVNLKAANLDNADLRNTTGCYFTDDNSIRGTRFTTKGTDPYSLLRRTYTGPMFFLILCLTIIAFTPYILKALAWSYVGSIESKADILIQEGTGQLKQDLPASVINDIQSLEKKINPSSNEKFKKSYVISIITGFEESKPFIAVFITLILIVYNSIRGWVTFRMGTLRDAEERSQHTPEKVEYISLYNVHSLFLKWFMIAAFLVAAWNVVILLTTPVYIPI